MTSSLSVERIRASLAAYSPEEQPRTPHTRLAAVAAILRRPEDPEVLLIKRASKVEDPWSAHMALPGGRAELGDADLVHTAMRETHEEVGLDLRGAAVLGRLDDIRAVGRMVPIDMLIVPYVFALDDPAAGDALALNHEVDYARWARLEPMRNGQADRSFEQPYAGRILSFPGYGVGDDVVWGLTYRMLQSLFEAVGRLG